MSHGRLYHRVVLKAVMLICSAMSTSIVHAEYFGSPTGRTAKFSSQTPLAVEVGVSKGEFENADYKQMGVRLNYQHTPNIVVFGDLGQSELDAKSETSFGLGAYYSLEQSILGSDDSAVKLSVHKVDFETVTVRTGGGSSVNNGCRWEITALGPNLNCIPQVSSSPGRSYTRGGSISNIAIELLISSAMPDSILGDAANWYANGGIQLLNGAVEDDAVLGFGAGFVVPVAESEVYAGFEYAGATYVGVGIRYFIQ